jgi:hypothetical protein
MSGHTGIGDRAASFALTSARLRLIGVGFVALAVSILRLPAAVLLGVSDLAATIPPAGDLAPRLAAARILLSGQGSSLYQLDRQQQFVRLVFDGRYPDYVEPYLSPPFVGLAYIPLAGLPYRTAALAWLLTIAVLVLIALFLLRPFVPVRWSALLLAGSWPVVVLLINGQDSPIALLILAAGLRLLLVRRDGWAGAVLALGLYKPQLFLLIPVVLLCQRRFRALTGYASAAGALILLSIWLVGLTGLVDWLHLLTSPVVRDMVLKMSWNQLSLAALARGVLGASPLLPVLTAAFAIIPTILLVAYARSLPVGEASMLHLYGVAIVVGLLVTPYAFVYDGIVLTVPLALAQPVLLGSPLARRSAALAYVLLWSNLPRYIAFGGSAYPVAILAGAIAPLALAGFALGFAYSSIAATGRVHASINSINRDRVG